MGEDADKPCTGRDDPVGHFKQLRIIWLETAAMIIAVKLDENGWLNASGLVHIGQGIGLLDKSSSSFTSAPVRRQSSMARPADAGDRPTA